MTPKAQNRAKAQTALVGENQPNYVLIGVVSGVLILVAMLAYLVWQATLPLPGRAIAIQSRTHITVGQPHDPYNSDPPTSGPHYDSQPLQSGFYEEPLQDEFLIHALEHGYVVISYNCELAPGQACEDLKTQIRDAMGQAGVSNITGLLKVIATPRTTIKFPVVLTSWGRMYEMTAFNRDEALRYIRNFRDTAPENQGQ